MITLLLHLLRLFPFLCGGPRQLAPVDALASPPAGWIALRAPPGRPGGGPMGDHGRGPGADAPVGALQ
jgi:hypothetical protein